MIDFAGLLSTPSGLSPARNLLLSLAPGDLGKYALYPEINAALNGTSAVLLFVGRGFILRGRMAAHRTFMLAALASSTPLFLGFYLYYHFHILPHYFNASSVHFQGHGLSRPVYFAILISHTILAAIILPLIIVTLSRALRERFDRHRAIARWTYPLWMYTFRLPA